MHSREYARTHWRLLIDACAHAAGSAGPPRRRDSAAAEVRPPASFRAQRLSTGALLAEPSLLPRPMWRRGIQHVTLGQVRRLCAFHLVFRAVCNVRCWEIVECAVPRGSFVVYSLVARRQLEDHHLPYQLRHHRQLVLLPGNRILEHARAGWFFFLSRKCVRTRPCAGACAHARWFFFEASKRTQAYDRLQWNAHGPDSARLLAGARARPKRGTAGRAQARTIRNRVYCGLHLLKTMLVEPICTITFICDNSCPSPSSSTALAAGRSRPCSQTHQITCCSCLLPAQVSIAVLLDNFRSASKAQRQREAAAAVARNVKSTNPLDPLLLHLCKVRGAAWPRDCSVLSAATSYTMPKPAHEVE